MALKPNTTIMSLFIFIGTIAVLYSCGDTTTEPTTDSAMQTDRKSTRLNSSHTDIPRMPSSA